MKTKIRGYEVRTKEPVSRTLAQEIATVQDVTSCYNFMYDDPVDKHASLLCHHIGIKGKRLLCRFYETVDGTVSKYLRRLEEERIRKFSVQMFAKTGSLIETMEFQVEHIERERNLVLGSNVKPLVLGVWFHILSLDYKAP